VKIFQSIAQSFVAMENCRRLGNDEWFETHRGNILELCRNKMPSGSGFDDGTSFDFSASKPNKLVFITSFHHMTNDGFYDGWTSHTVTVVPAFSSDIDMRISGKDHNDIKDYIADVFRDALREETEK
jgi:hypothetical protein